MTRCPTCARLYRELYAACRQLTLADGDAATCAALASLERDKPERVEAVAKIREHLRGCEVCNVNSR